MFLVCLVKDDRGLTQWILASPHLRCFCAFVCRALDLSSHVVDQQIDAGCHLFVMTIHVDVSCCFCIFAMLENTALFTSKWSKRLQRFVEWYVALQ